MSEESKKIEALAFEYAESRDARMAQLKDEIDKRDDLIEAMEEEGMEVYTRNNLTVVLDHKTKVKVRVSGSEGEEEL